MSNVTVLFYDTETTGLINKSTKLDDQPHVLSLAYSKIKFEVNNISEFVQLDKNELYVKVDFKVPASITAINGITDELLDKDGHELSYVCNAFLDILSDVDVVICHNTVYDMQIMSYAALRTNNTALLHKLLTIRTYCTSAYSKTYSINANKSKRMRLTALHALLFGKEHDSAHNALSDVIALQNCFIELFKLKEINAAHITAKTASAYIAFSTQNDDIVVSITTNTIGMHYPNYASSIASSNIDTIVNYINSVLANCNIVIFKDANDYAIFTKLIAKTSYLTTFAYKLVYLLTSNDVNIANIKIDNSTDLCDLHAKYNMKFNYTFSVIPESVNTYLN